MNFKFDLSEKVKVKSKGKTGTVQTQKHENYLIKGNQSTTILYYINYGNYMCDWVKEDDLESIDNPVFNDKFEKGFLDLLIDANLAVGNYDQVKHLQQEKEKYTK